MLLLIACIAPPGKALDDSNSATTDESVAFETVLPVSSDSWDGFFMYGTSDGYLYEDGALTDMDVWSSYSYAFVNAAPNTEWVEPALFTDPKDHCWTAAGFPSDPAFQDVGRSLSASVDVNDLSLRREDYGGSDIEYWWDPDPNTPSWALQQGSAIRFENTATGLAVPEPLLRTDFDSTWAEYRETGDLHLRWEPGSADARIEVWRLEDDGTTGSICELLDDGEAEMVFPTPPSAAEPTLFTNRTTVAAIDVEGIGRVLALSTAILSNGER